MYNYNESRYAQTTLGISERWERVLAYSLGWISGLILLLVEHRNQTVRRHAAQSVLIFGALSLIGLALAILAGVFGWIPLLGWALGGFFSVILGIVKGIGFVAWVLLMIGAYFSSKTFLTGPRYERY